MSKRGMYREELMRRRNRHRLNPVLEPIEPRTLMSVVTTIMAANQSARMSVSRIQSALTGTTTSASSSSRFTPSSTSIAVPQNQGYLDPASPGYNLVLQPTGTATAAEVRRQIFKAVYSGPYVIAPGSFSSQALQVFIRGAGTSTSMLHSDIQLRLAMASDPTLLTTGASVIFDRNLNSNSALGFNLSSPRGNVDSQGRPNRITGVTLDVNSSSGAYVEGFAQGEINIHYYPSKRRLSGAYEQGTAVVKIKAQVYSGGVAFILRNADINP